MNHRYILEKYKGPATRYTCPSCGHKREFTRYIDTYTGEHLSPATGICNRANNCGYNYTPKQFFTDNPLVRTTGYLQNNIPPKPPRKKVHIPSDILERSLVQHYRDPFVKYLHTILPPHEVKGLLDRYSVGTCKGPAYWNTPAGSNCTVFWYINKANEIRYGQVKFFYDNGHTAKYVNAFRDGELCSCTTGIHYLLKQQHKQLCLPQPKWLTDYEQQDIYMDCFFGEYLLNDPEYDCKPIAIVEAPKTAIIATAFMPEYLWLAVGSLSCLTAMRCKILEGKNVTLFPDLGAYHLWKERADKIPNIRFRISYFLERTMKDAPKTKGMDIADYFAGKEKS